MAHTYPSVLLTNSHSSYSCGHSSKLQHIRMTPAIRYCYFMYFVAVELVLFLQGEKTCELQCYE